MKNKFVYLVLFILWVGILYISSFLLKNSSDISNKTSVSQKKAPNIVNNSFLLNKDKLMNIPLTNVNNEISINWKTLKKNIIFNNNITEYWNIIKNECKTIPKWKDPILLKWEDILVLYQNSLDILNKNEYDIFSKFVSHDCASLQKEFQLPCELYSSGDLINLDKEKSNLADLEYNFIKSAITKINTCNTLSDKESMETCTKNVKILTDLNSFSWTTIELSSPDFEKWSFLSKYWKIKYKETIDTLFLDNCSKLLNTNF